MILRCAAVTRSLRAYQSHAKANARTLTTIVHSNSENAFPITQSNSISIAGQPVYNGTACLKRGVRKVRQHVNPLQASYQRPIELDERWIEESFSPLLAYEQAEKDTIQAKRDFVVDVGCAEGRFTLDFARSRPDLNVLGLEIRRPMVAHCLQEKQLLALQNVYFLACNANVDLKRVLQSIQRQGHRVDTVLFQFPDPHFKRRNHKRRVVNFALVRALAECLPRGTKLFVQSDIEELARDMVFRIGSAPWFSPVEGYDTIALSRNPSPNGVQTDREKKTLAKGQPVFRMLYVRNNSPANTPWIEPTEDKDDDMKSEMNQHEDNQIVHTL